MRDSNTSQLLDYMNNSSSNELLTEIPKPYGIKFADTSTTGVKSSASNMPLDDVDDLERLKSFRNYLGSALVN